MKKLIFLLLLFSALAFQSCQKDADSSPAALAEDELTAVVPDQDEDGAVTDRAGCSQTILIPANSVDALANALANVCTGGTIWLASGLHTENAGVVIGKRVNIKGEDGAVLRIQASPELTFTNSIDVALHFKFATKSSLENVTIEPTSGPGGTAVLVEKSGGTTIKDCHITNFQFSILVHTSVGVNILDNVIVATNAWQTGALPEADGIIVINGSGARVKGNDVSQGLFGIFCSDREGIYEKNYTHHNYIGLILCNVPKGFIYLPGGENAYAKFPATHWTVRNNVSKHNLDAGYIIIDGANKNKLISNEGGDNGTYDFDFVGDSYRFGFLTPTCYNNVMWANEFQDVTVKDCGVDNIIYGGALVDNSVYPCL